MFHGNSISHLLPLKPSNGIRVILIYSLQFVSSLKNYFCFQLYLLGILYISIDTIQFSFNIDFESNYDLEKKTVVNGLRESVLSLTK